MIPSVTLESSGSAADKKTEGVNIIYLQILLTSEQRERCHNKFTKLRDNR